MAAPENWESTCQQRHQENSPHCVEARFLTAPARWLALPFKVVNHRTALQNQLIDW